MLWAGAAGLTVASAAHRTRAHDPQVDLDVNGYGGSGTGGWACGPSARVQYAGAALDAKLSERGFDHEEGPGFHGSVGAAIERETVKSDTSTLVFDVCPSSDPNCVKLPPATIMGAAHFRLGWGGRWFGFELGALGYQGWRTSSYSDTSWNGFPELEIRVGPSSAFYGVVGCGSDLPTTLRRPAAIFIGLGGTYETVGMDVRVGFNRAGPSGADDFALRADVLARVELVPDLRLVPGLAVQFPDRGSTLGYEGSLGVRLGF